MSPLARFVRSRLRRRIFVWFGVTIVLSGLVGGAIVDVLSGSHGAWRESVDRATVFVGHRFAEVWDDEEARDHLASAASEELRLSIELRDVQGRSIARFGGECPTPHEFSAPVERDGEQLGSIEACLTTPPTDGLAMGLALGAVLLMLWAASGAIAWRLTRPLAQLVRVTRAIGEGHLDARASLPRVPDDLAVLGRSINEMAERIQRQLTEQRELLAVVSHEIRTPLGHLRVLLDLARDTRDPSTLDEMETELLEVDRLVDRLLASLRLDFGQLDRRRLRADEVAARAVARAGLLPALVRVETEALELEGDPTLLGRALGNLLDNARVHGKGAVALRVCEREGRLCFVVEDEGAGLPSSREHLFESFVRGEEGGKLGLGLSLVQRIAAAHGGRAFAEDREGGGARVGLCIDRGIEPAPPTS